MSQLIVGLGFCRQVGKDTLARLLGELDRRFVPYSFAHALKNDLAPFILRHFGFNIWNCTPEQKELARPMLISYGMAQRARDPDYWVKRALSVIQDDLSEQPRPNLNLIPILTDVRFSNEERIFRETFPGFRLVSVTRDGAPPPTEEEEKHYRALVPLADYRLHWGDDTEQSRLDKAEELMDQLLFSAKVTA